LNSATAAIQHYLQINSSVIYFADSFPQSAFYPAFRIPFRIFGFRILPIPVRKALPAPAEDAQVNTLSYNAWQLR